MRTLLLVLSIISLVGCGILNLNAREMQQFNYDEYINLSFDKLSGKMLLDEVTYRYVRIDADFGYLFNYQDISGYPADRWIRMCITKDSMRYDNVMVPKSEADKYFSLLKGEPITIFAKTTVWSARSFTDMKNIDEIALSVTRIERRLTKEVVRFPDITHWKLIDAREQDGVQVKKYQKDGETVTVYYEGEKPTGFWKAPIHRGQNMTTYCDKDGDGIFETILTNNPNCYYTGR